MADRRNAAQIAIDKAFLNASVGAPAGVIPTTLANSPALLPRAVPPAVVAAVAAGEAVRPRTPLFADRPAYRQQGYAPSDGFPGPNAAVAGATRVYEDQAGMPMMAVPAAAQAANGAVMQQAVADQPSLFSQVETAARGAFPMLSRVADFAGMFGKRSDTDAIKVPAAAATNPVASAMKQGRAAPAPTITPQDRLSYVIGKALSGGASVREINQMGALIPAAIKPSASAKDRAIATATGLADQMFEQEYKAAQALPDQAASQEAMRVAAANYRDFYSAIAGVDPAQLALAKQLKQKDDE